MKKHSEQFSVSLGIGLLITYMLAVFQGLDIKTPGPNITNAGNIFGTILGSAAVLIATGTYVATMFLLSKYQVENNELRGRLEEMTDLYNEERWKAQGERMVQEKSSTTSRQTPVRIHHENSD